MKSGSTVSTLWAAPAGDEVDYMLVTRLAAAPRSRIRLRSARIEQPLGRLHRRVVLAPIAALEPSRWRHTVTAAAGRYRGQALRLYESTLSAGYAGSDGMKVGMPLDEAAEEEGRAMSVRKRHAATRSIRG
jgi:hypothetical protein